MSNEPSELAEAYSFLRQAKPSMLSQMQPMSPLVTEPVPAREARFDLGIPPKSLIGGIDDGGGSQGTVEVIVLVAGQLKYADAVLVVTGDVP